MVSKDSIWSEQNLVWQYGFGPFHGPGPGKLCGPSGFPGWMHTDDKRIPQSWHGVTFIGVWACNAFTLSAVLYVDDSILFHMAIKMPFDEEFLQLVQSATNDWAGLVHATGGCSSHRNASGTCSAGYGRRGRHVSRLCMSCHRIHYTYLSQTKQESRYN